MSEIQRFSQALLENKDLADELKDVGNDLEKIVKFANSRGFNFSAQELAVAAEESGTLTEEELDAVSGGFLTCVAGVSFQIGDGTGLSISAKAKALAVL